MNGDMTRKLYYEDLYQTNFSASVIEAKEKDGKFHVALDQTVFYPEVGGQPCDTGYLDDIPVEQVYEEKGKIFHVMGAMPQNQNVDGRIDWERRFIYMQQHLGQHILSAVLVEYFHTNTIGLRLGDVELSIDIDHVINRENLERAEQIANEMICRNIPVEVLYPTMEEIERFSKRKIPQTNDAIRIVKIGDLDYTPCCGTQNKSTGEVGLIKIFHAETNRTGMRVHFSCGSAALQKCSHAHNLLESIKRELSCRSDEILVRVQKIKAELQDEKSQREQLMDRVLESDAQRFLEQAYRVNNIAVIKQTFEATSQEELRKLHSILTAQKGVVVILGAKTQNGVLLLMGCNKGEKRIDVRKAFHSSISMINGKGGGSACYSQGLGQNAEQLVSAVDHAFEEIICQIPNGN